MTLSYAPASPGRRFELFLKSRQWKLNLFGLFKICWSLEGSDFCLLCKDEEITDRLIDRESKSSVVAWLESICPVSVVCNFPACIADRRGSCRQSVVFEWEGFEVTAKPPRLSLLLSGTIFRGGLIRVWSVGWNWITEALKAVSMFAYLCVFAQVWLAVTMGGEQSRERKEEEEEAEKHDESANTESSGPAGDEDPPAELPQCQMGNRKVDNMCFMISCTNWY